MILSAAMGLGAWSFSPVSACSLGRESFCLFPRFGWLAFPVGATPLVVVFLAAGSALVPLSSHLLISSPALSLACCFARLFSHWDLVVLLGLHVAWVAFGPCLSPDPGEFLTMVLFSCCFEFFVVLIRGSHLGGSLLGLLP